MSGERLYNGIVLPEEWPPRRTREDIQKRDPMPVPYLRQQPEVIPIDVGRQLFVDDFLVERTTLTRTFHAAEDYDANPVLKPEKRWEGIPGNPTAGAFSDGVFYDPAEKCFKMWYRVPSGTCYATSGDGIRWERSSLGLMPGTNLVCLAGSRDSSTIWLDLEEKDPGSRYKMFAFHRDPWLPSVYRSGDGIHWDLVSWCGKTGDRSTMFYNPFRKVWVYSIRESAFPGPWSYPANPVGRCRRYRECGDFFAGARWGDEEPAWWVGADHLDEPRPDVSEIQQELYNLDAVAYESVLLGLFSIWRHHPADRPKINEVLLGFSRDGFHWDRACRKAFIPVSERREDWNWFNVQSCGGGCLVVGDRLYFYYSGRGMAVNRAGRAVETQCTGLATLRRDGFASMDAGDAEGALTTRPVRFRGRYLFVNADVDEGELRAEVMGEDGMPLAPFTREACVPVREDRTLLAVRWQAREDLSELAGRPVRLRFHLKNGRLYAFWVSPNRSGASHGYVAAGGPGFTGPTDTVGAS